MTARRRVVITGMGAVHGFGWTVHALRDGLRSGRSAIGTPQEIDLSGHRTSVVSEVPAPPGYVRLDPGLSRADSFAVVAATEAWCQAGLPEADAAGVILGGSTAAMAECEHFFGRLLGVRPGHPRIALLASQQINGPGDAVARKLGARGPVMSVSSACSSGGLAIQAALDELRTGAVDVILAGGSDALCHLTHAGFNALRSVDPRPCRPFRSERAGLNIGEGAGVLVLETADHASRRGARPLAELLGAGSTCDAHHMTAPHPKGRGAAAAIRNALADAGVEPERVDFVNAHGTGTPLNDAAEARALAEVFAGLSEPPVTATKGALGHLLGSSGAIEAIATVLCLCDGEVYPTPGAEPADPDLGVDLVIGAPRPLTRPGVAVSTSFAFGGANAALVLAALEKPS